MPSVDHEMILSMFQKHPALATELLTSAFNLDLPAHERASPGPEAFTTSPQATTRLADRTVLLSRGDRTIMAIIVECQLDRSIEKRFTWPLYMAHARDLWKCPAVLLVLSPDPGVARWCAQPIQLGHPGLVLTPLVLSQDNTPLITDPNEAIDCPELTALSALAHGNGPHSKAVLTAFCHALPSDRDRAADYYEYVGSNLTAVARPLLEEIMTMVRPERVTELGRTNWRLGEQAGEAKGKAESILDVFEDRGLALSDDVRERVLACADVKELRTWLSRSLTVERAEDIFQP